MYSPRIYTYKITFEEVPYYYYGVHKEKVFGEEYWGSPYTNKWCWELYTPKKQILEFFEFSDVGWSKAQKVETRIIKQFYNTDNWCLNENCGGNISLEVLRETGIKNGKKQGKINFENKIGFFALTKEERIEIGKKSGKKKKLEFQLIMETATTTTMATTTRRNKPQQQYRQYISNTTNTTNTSGSINRTTY